MCVFVLIHNNDVIYFVLCVHIYYFSVVGRRGGALLKLCIAHSTLRKGESSGTPIAPQSNHVAF